MRKTHKNKKENIWEIKDPSNTIFFFLENVFKKTAEYILKFVFLFESTILQMAALTGHAVAYMIGPFFKHIIDCVQLYFTNSFTNIVL